MTTTVTVNSGGGADFTTIQAAIDDSDVSTEDYIVEVQNNAAYVENLTLGGSTGTPTIANYLHLTATDAAYHAGVAGAGARVTPSGADHSIEVTEDFARISKMLVEMSTGSANSNECVRISADDTLVDRCILDARGSDRTTNDGDCYYTQTDNITQTLYNTLMIDADRAHVDLFDPEGGTFNMEFCTGYLSAVTETGGTEEYSFIIPRNGVVSNMTTNLYNNTSSRKGTANQRVWSLTQDTGTILNASHNASGRTGFGANDTSGDPPGTNLVEGLVDADAYTDPTNFDLSILDTDSELYLAGTDRSGSLPDSRVDATVDIRGTARPGTPSIGAFEFDAGGGAAESSGAVTVGTFVAAGASTSVMNSDGAAAVAAVTIAGTSAAIANSDGAPIVATVTAAGTSSAVAEADSDGAVTVGSPVVVGTSTAIASSDGAATAATVSVAGASAAIVNSDGAATVTAPVAAGTSTVDQVANSDGAAAVATPVVAGTSTAIANSDGAPTIDTVTAAGTSSLDEVANSDGAVTVGTPVVAGTSTSIAAGDGAAVVATVTSSGSSAAIANSDGATAVATATVAGTSSVGLTANSDGASVVATPVADGTSTSLMNSDGAPVVASPVAAGASAAIANSDGAAVIDTPIAVGTGGAPVANSDGAAAIDVLVAAGSSNAPVASSGALLVESAVLVALSTVIVNSDGSMTILAPVSAGTSSETPPTSVVLSGSFKTEKEFSGSITPEKAIVGRFGMS